MKYFANIAVVYTTKNKAHKAIQEYALSMDATLLPDEKARDRFIQKFREKIERINEKYTRCNDIQLSGYMPPVGASHSISVYSNFTMVIYPVKNDTTLN